MFKKSASTIVIVLLSISISLVISPWARGADFPQKPIRIIVGSQAGGGDDTETRGIAPYLEKFLGVKVITENMPGAGGRIAFEKLMGIPPDGYSLMATSFPRSIIIEKMDKVGFRTKDYTPIFIWSRTDTFLVVNAETWKTFNEFIKAAKSKPLSIAIPGRGGTNHLTGLMITDKLGIKVTWVPYETGAECFTALSGMHVDAVMGSSIGTLSSLIDAGILRPLACLSNKRNPFFPNIPTIKEQGIDINPVVMYRGVEAPPKTPPSVVKILDQAFDKAVRDPSYTAWAKKSKMVVNPLNANEFRTLVDETYPTIEKFKHVLKDG